MPPFSRHCRSKACPHPTLRIFKCYLFFLSRFSCLLSLADLVGFFLVLFCASLDFAIKILRHKVFDKTQYLLIEGDTTVPVPGQSEINPLERIRIDLGRKPSGALLI